MGGLAMGCHADTSAQPEQTLTGQLSVIMIDNFEDGTASRAYRLKGAGTDRPVLLDVPKAVMSAHDWSTGQRVRVKGVYVTDGDAADSRRFHVESMDPIKE
jgi:hypothetical protein